MGGRKFFVKGLRTCGKSEKKNARGPDTRGVVENEWVLGAGGFQPLDGLDWGWLVFGVGKKWKKKRVEKSEKKKKNVVNSVFTYTHYLLMRLFSPQHKSHPSPHRGLAAGPFIKNPGVREHPYLFQDPVLGGFFSRRCWWLDAWVGIGAGLAAGVLGFEKRGGGGLRGGQGVTVIFL